MAGDLLKNADALTASGMAAYAAAELKFAGFFDSREDLERTAGECVVPLLRAAAIALELSGALGEEESAAVHDIITDFITAPRADSSRIAA